MRIILIVFFFSCFLGKSFGQSTVQLYDSISQAIEKKEFQKAINVFENYSKMNQATLPNYILNDIAKAYLNITDTASAEAVLNIAKKDTSEKSFNNIVRETYKYLIEINTNRGAYNIALKYFLEREEIHPEFRICSRGNLTRLIRLNYEKALLYEKANLLDSSINCLTPYMFYDSLEIDQEVNSVFYKEVVNYYAKLLHKTNPNSLKSIKSSIHHLEIEKRIINEGSLGNYQSIEAYLTYRKIRFVLSNRYVPANCDKYRIRAMKKWRLKKRLKKSYLYKALASY
jgi:tetratricopeptide (TPR) repeat protein